MSAHELDLLIATTLGRDPSHQYTLPSTFQQYVQIHQQVAALTEEANELADHADFCDSLANWNLLEAEGDEKGSDIQALQSEAREARKKAEEMVQYLLNSPHTL